jgi:hypothetical protein
VFYKEVGITFRPVSPYASLEVKLRERFLSPGSLRIRRFGDPGGLNEAWNWNINSGKHNISSSKQPRTRMDGWKMDWKFPGESTFGRAMGCIES